MSRYRKKSKVVDTGSVPVVVEAMQFRQSMWPYQPYTLMDRVKRREAWERVDGEFTGRLSEWFVVETLEGEMHVSDGDWIITGVQGEMDLCKPDIFEQTYEPVE